VQTKSSFVIVSAQAATVAASWGSLGETHAQVAAQQDYEPPAVFLAAGTSVASLESVINEFRAALGGGNNGNGPGVPTGRREINWDGGGAATGTAIAVTPFDGFLNTRGARFETPGTGFVQATPSGLSTTFGNASYESIFRPFSTFRLFSAIESNVTNVLFFVPGTAGTIAATTSGFGAVFTDVDQPDGSGPGGKRGNRGSSTLVLYYGADGKLLYSSFVPASPGDGTFSFLGIVFADARIAHVRIISGDVAPGPDDDPNRDVVVMDDFIYGEPQPVQ
jgi:hypothetical protein